MIEILVNAREVDKEAILKNRYGKGFPVVTKLVPCSWGGCESIPDYVKIRITDTDTLTLYKRDGITPFSVINKTTTTRQRVS